MLFDKNGSYIHTTIKFKNKTWKLIGCTSNGSVSDTIDEFRSNDYEYIKVERKRIAKGFLNGTITI